MVGRPLQRIVPIRSSSVFALALAVLLCDCGGETVAPGDRFRGQASRPVPCNVPNATCVDRIRIGQGAFLPVFSTHLLSLAHPGVIRALVVVHGNLRDADRYFETGVAVAAAGRLSGVAVVVAPHFQTAADGPATDESFWSNGGWKRGHLSSPEGPRPRVSSYEALDSVIAALTDPNRFPGMKHVVVAGHSAGGQVVHRLAATSSAQEHAPSGVTFRYVVTNPSTYLYLGPQRPGPDGSFGVPEAGCEDYDDWYYGLRDRNRYAGRLDPDTIRARLSRREVRVLLGAADTLDAALDQSCGARLQGVNRLTRGRAMMAFMDAQRPGHAHREFLVPGVGHSSRAMWLSQVGLQVLLEESAS